MPRFMAQVVTDIEFVGGSEGEGLAAAYEHQLADALQQAARKISLRTIQGNKVLSVQVGEIKVSQ
jgi:hypothetical protein